MVRVYWLAKQGTTCARCRWDGWYVEDLLSGHLKRPGSQWPEVDHREVGALPRTDFAVVSFPAGAHADDDVAWLNRELAKVHSVVLFITSDEASRFPVHLIKHRDLALWVMEPRPELSYPEGTNFIGCGSARAGRQVTPPLRRVTPLWFVGQGGHARRDQMIAAASSWPAGSVCDVTAGFLQGMEREDYLVGMSESKLVACPAGAQSQDSFRLHEALDLGCVPVADGLRPDGEGKGYWDMVMPHAPFPVVNDWAEFDPTPYLEDYPWFSIRCHSWWHLHRRELARRFRSQLPLLFPPSMTVVIPTSPIPSHPDTRVIGETISSIRDRTDAEILVMCDGVRPEQWGRRGAYGEYLQRLCSLCEVWDNVTPVVYPRFLHQAEMLRKTLDLVATQYVLFVEHDTPLVGDIPFDRIFEDMDEHGFNCVRFYHEVAIHPEHAHLMLDRVGEFRRTMQWSQRPHLAHTGWYHYVLDKYFAAQARTMIEDVMVGPLEHDLLTEGAEGWDNWRIAVYEPEGNIQRSVHTDGRAGEPKFPMRYRYPDGEAPAGAPRPNKGF